MPSKKVATSKPTGVKKTRSVTKRVKKTKPNKTAVKTSEAKPRRLTGLVPAGVYHKASLLVLSPYRLPVDAEKLAIQSARLAGLAFVFIGAILTVFHVPGMSEQLSSGGSAIQQASVFDALRGTEFAVVQSSVPTNLPSDLRTRRITDSDVLTGYGKPNTPTLIYFFTAPAVASIVTDDQGGWTYDTKNISLKSDRVAYVAVTDNALMPEPITAKDSLEAAVLAAEFDSGVLNLLLSVGIIVLGLLLLLLGMHLRSGRKENNLSLGDLSASKG